MLEITEALKPIVVYDYTVDGMRRLIAALTARTLRLSEELVDRRHELSIDPERAAPTSDDGMDPRAGRAVLRRKTTSAAVSARRRWS